MVDWKLNNMVEHIGGSEFKVVENDFEQDFPNTNIQQGDVFRVVDLKEHGDGVSYSLFVEKEGERLHVTADKGFLRMLNGRGIIEKEI